MTQSFVPGVVVAHDPDGGVERISLGERLLAIVVRAHATASSTRFLTPDDINMQLGFIVYPKGGAVQPHAHIPVVRTTRGTLEALLVRGGECSLDLYDDARVKIATTVLGAGDIVLLVDGGHGFRMHVDTVLMEIKQGPFPEGGEKIRFDDPGQ